MGGSLRWPPWIPEPYSGQHQPATPPEPNGGKPQAATLDRRALLGEASGGHPGLHSLIGESISWPPWIPEPYWGKPQAGTLDPGALIGEPQEATLTPRSSWGELLQCSCEATLDPRALWGGSLRRPPWKPERYGSKPQARILDPEPYWGKPQEVTLDPPDLLR